MGVVRVLAVDPGKSTGYALAECGAGAGSASVILDCATGVVPWDGDEVGYAVLARQLLAKLMEESKIDFIDQRVLVVEDFILLPSVGGRGGGRSGGVVDARRDAISPVRVTSHLMAGLEMLDFVTPDVLVVRQQPGEAKSVVTNERLRRLNLWQVGATDHARDALRHLALYVRKKGLSTEFLWQK